MERLSSIIEKYEAKDFERPVPRHSLLNWTYFAGAYAGENVAGTEFVIGATFVSWGVSAESVIFGLIIGNFLAVMNWWLICTPIALEVRTSLYGYLKKIAGPQMMAIYNIVNAVLFCILSGAMITVSASAVRILFDVAPQLNWYPTSPAFVLIVLVIGFVVAVIAAWGFKGLAGFASICSPWMFTMFVAGALVTFPVIVQSTGMQVHTFNDFMVLANKAIWVEKEDGMGFWSVAAFAWICNITVNAGLTDMALFRYAKSREVGLNSAFGAFLGHYVAWVAAGIMGAGVALMMQKNITEIDPGAVAFNALGFLGIVTVILAGWTTSNPSTYRAGLAFHTLFSHVSIEKITFITGLIVSVVACFPFVFGQLLSFVGLMGVLLVPVGAIVFTEHWIFPKIGYTRYWATYKGLSLNVPALTSWVLAVAFALITSSMGIISIFFEFVPVYILTSVLYIVLAGMAGAKEKYPEEEEALRLYEQRVAEENAREDEQAHDPVKVVDNISIVLFIVSGVALIAILYFAGKLLNTDAASFPSALDSFKTQIILPTIVYFIAAYFLQKRSQ